MDYCRLSCIHYPMDLDVYRFVGDMPSGYEIEAGRQHPYLVRDPLDNEQLN